MPEMKQAWENQAVCNSLNEVNQRAAELTKREREHSHRMLEFNQPMAKYHAMDLCDLEHAMEDCISTADLAMPCLAATFGPSGDDESNMQEGTEGSSKTRVSWQQLWQLWKAKALNWKA